MIVDESTKLAYIVNERFDISFVITWLQSRGYISWIWIVMEILGGFGEWCMCELLNCGSNWWILMVEEQMDLASSDSIVNYGMHNGWLSSKCQRKAAILPCDHDIRMRLPLNNCQSGWCGNGYRCCSFGSCSVRYGNKLHTDFRTLDTWYHEYTCELQVKLYLILQLLSLA